MSGAPDHYELARQIAVMEERMKTMQADLSATLERFRTDMARRDMALYGLLVVLLAGVVLTLLRLYVFPAG